MIYRLSQLRWHTVLGLCVVCLAAATFIHRGLVRGLASPIDFAINYVSAQAWANGENPYDATTLRNRALRTGSETLARDVSWLVALYPPAANAILAPLAFVPWPRAAWLFLGLSSLAVAAAAVAMVRLLPDATLATTLYVLSAVLAFNPIVSGVATAQPSIVSCALLLIAMAEARHPFRAGALLGVAACMKPHLAVLFLLPFHPENRRRLRIVAALAISITLISLLPLIGVSNWLESWRSNLNESRQGANQNSPSPANPYSHVLLNFDAFLLLFTSSRSIATAGAWTLTLLLVLPLWSYRRTWTQKAGVLPVALQLVAAITLLPVYHRQYDASILAVAIPATVRMWHSEGHKLAVANAALLMGIGLPVVPYLRVLYPEWKSQTAPLYGQVLLHAQPLLVAGFGVVAAFSLKALASGRSISPSSPIGTSGN